MAVCSSVAAATATARVRHRPRAAAAPPRPLPLRPCAAACPAANGLLVGRHRRHRTHVDPRRRLPPMALAARRLPPMALAARHPPAAADADAAATGRRCFCRFWYVIRV
uniref:Uncharacterized protein n=1 Tax=Oryza sativa subsp. japonica TaxID=39947 RepID=Q7Y1K7_ORYSJ|nr:hypothetical protein [Oryza sativa Japonica Group]